MRKEIINKIYYVLLFCIVSTSLSFAAPLLSYEFHGIDGKILENVNSRLISMRANDKLVSPYLLYKKSKDEIKKGLQPYGYYHPIIHSQLIKYNSQKWKAVYYIILGKPLLIRNIHYSVTGPGSDNSEIHHYIDQSILHIGDPLNVIRYNEFKTGLFQVAKNQGYLKVHFENKVLIDLQNNNSQVFIHLDTGRQFYFGPIEWKRFPYSQAFMSRFISFKPGEVFSSQKILTLQQQMEKSYYFKRAVFIPDFANSDDTHVPVKAYFYAPAARSYSLGIGYGTLTGPRISGTASFRHLNDEGHHLEAEVKLSKVLSGVGATYYIPGKNPLTDEWLYGANYKSFLPKAGRSYSLTITGGYSKKYEKWQNSITLNYAVEKFLIFAYPPWEHAHTLYPSWKVTYINADNIVSPHRAFSINLTAQAAANALFSSTTFGSIQVRPKWIVSPSNINRIILRADAGVIDVRNLPKFPLSLRFFTGGMTSIRGFADSSIGPGKYLGVVSGEYQQKIKNNFWAAIFLDAGNASNHVKGKLNRGAGIGMIYDSSIGPFKIYLARALSKQTKPFSVEFSMGPEFS